MVKAVKLMKVDERKEIECVRKAFEHLPNLRKYEVSEKIRNSFTVAIEMSDGYRFTIQVHAMQNAYPSAVMKLLSQNKENDVTRVLVAPYISDRTASLCQENGIGYFDYAGNCYFSGHSIYLSERGHKNPEPERRSFVSVFETSSIVSSMILRELFADTKKVWKQKYLSEKVGCSIGQVSKVMGFLIKNAWADKSSDGYFLTDPASLLLEWSKVYGKEEKTAYSFYSLESPAAIERRFQSLKETKNIDYCLSGISGGVRYAPIVRYNKVHLYLKAADIQEAEVFMEMKEVSSGANIIIFPLEKEVYIRDSRTVDGARVVSPVQVYLDCMRIAGRGEEIAAAVLHKEILK